MSYLKIRLVVYQIIKKRPFIISTEQSCLVLKLEAKPASCMLAELIWGITSITFYAPFPCLNLNELYKITQWMPFRSNPNPSCAKPWNLTIVAQACEGKITDGFSWINMIADAGVLRNFYQHPWVSVVCCETTITQTHAHTHTHTGRHNHRKQTADWLRRPQLQRKHGRSQKGNHIFSTSTGYKQS